MEALTTQGQFDELIKKNTLMVRRIAHHLMMHLPYSIQVDDLIQAGMIGLLEAVKHYDPKKGASFETYAGIRIRGYMLDEVRRNEWVPRSVYRNSRLINNAIKEVENRLGRDAKDNEIADELHLDLDEYHSLQKDAAGSHLYGFDDLGVTEDALKGEEGDLNEPHERVLHEDTAQHLAELIKTLPQKERLVLALYYERDLNLKEIGDVLEVSESRVSQIHTQAMIHLKAKINAL
ncbi:MAG: RNA polymerase sigma factor FliA [Legionellales bacterium RIFCSPHIGHO2_12_FULL_42_9]|nr:MAG: RNA polymerase sigma factor FliA [Legionellales bacterium RIFCSPHIGHO2_12_FULL_42_9]